MRLIDFRSVSNRSEAGDSFIEILLAVGILGIVSVIFLTGVTVTSRAAIITDEHATAEGLARSQMEWAQNAAYTADAVSYSAAPIPSGTDYSNYSVNITALRLNNPDDGIQKITVTVTHSGKQVITLESYKADR